MPAELSCPQCHRALPDAALRQSDFQPCGHCQTPVRAVAYPALRHREVAAVGEAVLVEGESSCFFHPAKRAQSTCDQCGRFLCALCEVELAGRRLCPSCVAQGRDAGQLTVLETRRVRWDSLCLLLALLPLLMWPFTLLTAPAVLVLVALRWRAPASLVTPSKWRFVVAGLVALAELGGWTAFGVSFFLNRS